MASLRAAVSLSVSADKFLAAVSSMSRRRVISFSISASCCSSERHLVLERSKESTEVESSCCSLVLLEFNSLTVLSRELT